MNTLSVFPHLLTFGFVVPFLLRITVGIIFIYFGYTKILKEKERRISFFNEIGFGRGLLLFWVVSFAEIIGGIFLVVGVFTQVVAIVLSIITIGAICTKIRKPDLLDNSLEFFILLLVALVSLLFLGAGFFAMDLLM